MEVFVHRPKDDEVEVVTEIPGQQDKRKNKNARITLTSIPP